MIHVAVLVQQYLDLVLDGSKTIECRLTKQARAPFEAIEPGERIYFKRSAGPYAATAVCDHAIFESGLTPDRIEQLKRDYNHQIRGEDDYWDWKRDSRHASLIWLRDVEPTDTGPAIRPLQGVAWLTLEEEPAWRRINAHEQSFSIEVTEGNLRNNSLYATSVLDRFPAACIGGRTKAEAGRLITLILHDGPTIETDIVCNTKLLRTRTWGSWFRRHGVEPGDRVVFTPVDETTFFVGLTRSA